MKKKILYLTNFDNDSPEEDRYLIKVLQNDFEIIACHPRECEKYISLVEGVIIRNIWPTHEYTEKWETIKKLIIDSGIPSYNPLTGKGDNRGKDYLVKLYQRGFPVIPSINSIEDIGNLPESKYFWIKPKYGCDGSGTEKLTKAELLEENLKDYIIQPFEEFSYEPSFFFIDNVFSYAISMPSRLMDRDITMYTPTSEDLIFARQFVNWDTIPYGIQRVDAVRTKDDKLLLTEDEDIAEYLYILDIDEKTRDRVVKEIVHSIKNIFCRDI